MGQWYRTPDFVSLEKILLILLFYKVFNLFFLNIRFEICVINTTKNSELSFDVHTRTAMVSYILTL